MPPRALLLDFDGVLADSENHHVAAWQRTFSAMGWEMSDEACSRSLEMDDRAFLAQAFATRKIEGGDVEGWVRRKQDLTVAMLTDAPRLYPGVRALIEAVAARESVRLAVVTTTWRANPIAVLNAHGLESAFSLIIAKEDVASPKPDPEPYALALRRLGLEPTQAVALEDSASGLASARAAGLRAVAVGHRHPPGPWSGDAPYLPDLRNTPAVLAALGLMP